MASYNSNIPDQKEKRMKTRRHYGRGLDSRAESRGSQEAPVGSGGVSGLDGRLDGWWPRWECKKGRLRSKYRPKMHVWLCKPVGLTAYGVLTQRIHPGESREAGGQGVCISA